VERWEFSSLTPKAQESARIGSVRIACALLVVLFVCPIAGAAEASAPVNGIKLRSNVKVPMRDGIHLAADIYRPAAPGKFPCLMMLSPSWKQRPGDVDSAVYYAKRGYAVPLWIHVAATIRKASGNLIFESPKTAMMRSNGWVNNHGRPS